MPATTAPAAPTERPRAPDLQEWVVRYGGYHKIPWVEWDAANAQFQRARRAWLGAPIERSPAKHRTRGSAP